MAELQRSRAYVWLAVSSALIVLLASGVALSRLGNQGRDGDLASAPLNPPATGTDGGSGGGAVGGSGSGPAASAMPGTPGSTGGPA